MQAPLLLILRRIVRRVPRRNRAGFAIAAAVLLTGGWCAHAQPAGIPVAHEPTVAAQIPTNLDLLDRCAARLVDSLWTLRADTGTLRYTVAPCPAAFVVENSLVAAARSRGIAAVMADSMPELSIAIRQAGIAYSPTGTDDSVERTASVECQALMGNGARGRASLLIATASRDTIARDQVPMVEMTGYEFARGTLPSTSSGGFWSTVIEPAVVIGASVVMTILFFTVRSQ